MPGRQFRTALSAILAGVFLLSLGTEAFGWHDCPHHHRRAPAASASHSGDVSEKTTDAASAGLLQGARESRTGPHQHESGPCTCVGNCHGAAASPLPAVLPAVPAPADEVVRVVHRPDSRRQPLRLGAYFLPYPNGPPPA